MEMGLEETQRSQRAPNELRHERGWQRPFCRSARWQSLLSARTCHGFRELSPRTVAESLRLCR